MRPHSAQPKTGAGGSGGSGGSGPAAYVRATRGPADGSFLRVFYSPRRQVGDPLLPSRASGGRGKGG
jgi:hypothetical protein